jgi:hypothetical protein
MFKLRQKGTKIQALQFNTDESISFLRTYDGSHVPRKMLGYTEALSRI